MLQYILFEVEGESVKENRKNLDCKNCKSNIYNKETNKYVIEKENFDKIINKLQEIVNNIIEGRE